MTVPPLDLTGCFGPYFRDRTVFVAGVGTGINLALARAYAAAGAHVAVCGRREKVLLEAVEQLTRAGGSAEHVVLDVTDQPAVSAALSELVGRRGGLDVVVHGAAVNTPYPDEDLSLAGFDRVLDSDLRGAFVLGREAFPHLRDSKGTLLFISAPQAFLPTPYQSHVCAAKAGMDALMRTLAAEWGRHGIRCNSLVPGAVRATEGFRRLIPEAAAERLAAHLHLRRFPELDELARTALFLTSPLASCVTGAVLVADCGQSLLGNGLFSALLTEEV